MAKTDDHPPFGIIGEPSVLGMTNALRYLAERTGEPAFLKAAAALQQPSGGRPPIDDRLRLQEIAALLASGRARSARHAILLVARTASETNVSATAERLRRKFRDQQKKAGTKEF